MDERMLIENEDKKNKFYLVAIKNLIRKNNLSELNLKQSQGLLTKKEIEKEIKDNPNKYNVEQYRLLDSSDSAFVVEIYRELIPFFDEIGLSDISMEELSEMFSIDTEQFIETVQLLKSNLMKNFRQ